MALNILFVPYNTEEIARTYISKYNPKSKNQVILLMITDDKKWHNLAVKSLSALLRGITSNHNGDFYCLIFFNSDSTKNKLKKHEGVCYDQDCCYVEMPNDNCQNNPEKSYTEKKLSIHLLATHCLCIVHLNQWSCTQQKIKFIVTKAKIVCKTFVKTTRIINYEKKK